MEAFLLLPVYLVLHLVHGVVCSSVGRTGRSGEQRRSPCSDGASGMVGQRQKGTESFGETGRRRGPQEGGSEVSGCLL